MNKITPFLWLQKDAGQAAKFYVSVFKDAKIKSVQIMNNTPSGTVETVSMELFGQEFNLLSAKSNFLFNESISFMVNCETQEEVDYYWRKLIEDGGQESQCGWLKDKYGLSWQIVPKILNELLGKDKSGKVMQAMLKMKKIDILGLQQAFDEK
ncbi:MAG: VOC family protein [Candidatus Doudnabacteria bacterium]|jgi:predicted 3-demethylubiquinone-9 3-methyltransferase (glyoxalase superfamily)